MNLMKQKQRVMTKQNERKVMVKNKLVGLAALSLAAFSAVTMADTTEIGSKVNAAKKDIRIMSSILETSLQEALGTRSSHVKGSFLAGQGLYFELRSASHGPTVFRGVNRHIVGEYPGNVTFVEAGEIPDVPVPPVPTTPELAEKIKHAEEVVEAIVEMEFVTEDNQLFIEMSRDELQDLEREMQKVSALSRTTRGVSEKEQREIREKQRELRKKHYEFAKKANRVEREVRAVERKIRDAELTRELGDEKSEKKIIALQGALKDLSVKLKDIHSEMAEFKVEAAEMAKQAKKKVKDQQRDLLKSYVNVISEVTCSFGGGLKSVAKNEHITFYVNGFADQYFVFKQSDIQKCAIGDINSKELLSKAVTYQF